MGKLRKNSTGSFELIIGNHVLEGTSTPLKTPLVILQPVDSTLQFMGVDGLRSSVCEVQGIVREKILFKTRPNISVGALDEQDGDEVVSFITRS